MTSPAARRLLLGLVGVVVTTATVGCGLFSDITGHRHGADTVANQLRSMPGVAGVELDYSSNISSGERIGFTVTLDPDASPEQVGDLARTFLDHGPRQHLDRANSAELEVSDPAAATDNMYLFDESTASVALGSSSGGPKWDPVVVADAFSTWFSASSDPVVQSVTTNPAWAQAKLDTRIALRPEATAEQATALQTRLPGLADARWEINPYTDPDSRPNTYGSTPHPPSDHILALWQQISDSVAPYGHVTGTSAETVLAGRQATTDVELDLPTGAGSEPDQRRIAHTVAELLTRFGHPVQVKAHAGKGPIEFIVGGCLQHDPEHQRLPLELELSAQFEKC